MNVVLLLTHTSATSEVMPRQLTVELRRRSSRNALTVKIKSFIINFSVKTMWILCARSSNYCQLLVDPIL
jgi:hypothetical protein